MLLSFFEYSYHNFLLLRARIFFATTFPKSLQTFLSKINLLIFLDLKSFFNLTLLIFSITVLNWNKILLGVLLEWKTIILWNLALLLLAHLWETSVRLQINRPHTNQILWSMSGHWINTNKNMLTKSCRIQQ